MRISPLGRSRGLRGCAALLFSLALASGAVAAETVGWRGDGTGRFPEAEPPERWSKDSNIAWQLDLPGGGYASPVLVGQRLFVCAEPATLVCVAADRGEILWQAKADYAAALGPERAAEIEAEHERFESERRALKDRYDTLRKENPAAKELEELQQQIGDIENARKAYEAKFPRERGGGAGNADATPVSDGERIYAVFGTGVVAAFSLDGERLWAKHLGGSPIGFGHSASPLLAGGRLIVHVRELTALDPKTGEEAWQVELPAKHGSPVATKIGVDEVIITPSGAIVGAADGRLLAEKLFELSENSPLVHEGVIYAHGSREIVALQLGDSLGEPVKPEPLWKADYRSEQRMASAVWHEGRLYAASRRGILDVTDAATGRPLFKERLDVGEIFSSLTAAGGLVYASGRDGRTAVIRPAAKYEEVVQNELENFSSTPLFAGSKMFIRTSKKLYCVEE